VQTLKVSPILGTSKRIIYNVEYSMSKASLRLPLLTGVFAASILLLFLTANWLSISTTRESLYGGAAVGNLNYASLNTGVFPHLVSYLQSSEYSFADKVSVMLTAPVVTFGSHDQNTGDITAAFNLDIGMLVNVISMSFLLSLYTNIFLLVRKSSCKIGRATPGTGMLGGATGIGSVILSMLLMAGCCGGTGIAFLLFGLPLIGSVLSGFYSTTDTSTLLLITIPAFIVHFVGLMYLMSRRFSLEEEDNSRKGAVVSSWLSVSVYLTVSAIFLFTFMMGIIWWNQQSSMVATSGMTGGMQSMTIVMFSTLPLSSSLLLVSALVQIRKIRRVSFEKMLS
jgi:hypothetical protein